METTLFLSQVFGLFLIVMGIAVTLRHKHYIAILPAFAKDGLLRMIVAAFELLAGLFLVLAHPVWEPLPAAIVTIIGWLAILEGVFYLIASNEAVARTVSLFNRPVVYWISGPVCILIGAYLANYGFGLSFS